MEAPKPAMTTSTQPQAVQMSEYSYKNRVGIVVERQRCAGVMSPPTRNSTQQCERQKASRLRGGGAGRVSA